MYLINYYWKNAWRRRRRIDIIERKKMEDINKTKTNI
jgi:hypothetical protein